MSNLGQRLTVAAVGIPVVAAVTWIGGAWFAAGLAVLAAIATSELMSMLRQRGSQVPARLAVLAAASFPLLVYVSGLGRLWLPILITLFLVTAYTSLTVRPEDGPFTSAALTLTGVLGVGGLLSFGVALRAMGTGRVEGTFLFLLPVVLTWVTDSAAYFGGRAFGRRQLAPIISPNKTREGGLAGLLAGGVGAVIYVWLFLPDLYLDLGIGGLAAFGVAIAAAATVGDLAESALKRECGVKDSSALLPGHGGLLDRMDSLLWTIPTAFVLLWMAM
ncbi:MAG: phosphatidate cytidylyltransferase [Gemmatimonadota bacterium]